MTTTRAERPHALDSLMRRALLFGMRRIAPSGRRRSSRPRPAGRAPATAREDMW